MKISLKSVSSSTPIVIDLLLLLVSALLFALSFPNFVFKWGFFPLAYIALIPVFITVRRASWPLTLLYGALYGFICYCLYNYWLAVFHPLTLAIVPPIHSVYFILIFPLLKAADSLFPRHGYLLQSFLWVGYEFFIKSQGFLAYSYGIIGYSQYLFLPLIRLAGLTGVWGISLLVVFPSAFLGNALKSGFKAFLPCVKKMYVPIIIYCIVFTSVLIYGILNKSTLNDARKWKVALIQQNADPWKGGDKPYKKALDILTRLSSEALKEEPEIIIWSETSFVPAIDWHTRYRTDRDRYKLVKQLRDYLSDHEQAFVIGNDDRQLVRNEYGQDVSADYNATILFHKGEIVSTYRKLHLVPFTEHFPFRKFLPGIYEWLRNADTHFWEKGREYTVFEADGVKFSTPICFEDTFGYLCRGFIRQGAEVLVNMTNDSWANSVACEMQHMIMGVFRAVENKRTLVRATNGGITCVVDPNGRIVDWLEPFTESYLIASVPVFTGRTTLYTLWGDWFPYIILCFIVSVFALGIVRRMLKRNH